LYIRIHALADAQGGPWPTPKFEIFFHTPNILALGRVRQRENDTSFFPCSRSLCMATESTRRPGRADPHYPPVRCPASLGPCRTSSALRRSTFLRKILLRPLPSSAPPEVFVVGSAGSICFFDRNWWAHPLVLAWSTVRRGIMAYSQSKKGDARTNVAST
jgi:hypothetical protein